MKIHSVTLQDVRHLRELTLDLSAPLTIIGGPNGAGKTTLHESILAAMFLCEKAIRDGFVSQFDPDSAPIVTLGLSRGEQAPTIRLIRNLRDDKGEWHEGGTVAKKKKQALEKVQEVLPLSADAAALLLWGRQDDMPAVVESFPSDGHTLLTRATIQGAGPDPKTIIEALEKDSDHARQGGRGGQVVGSLVGAKNQLAVLVAELETVRNLDAELRGRRQQLHEAKQRRDQLKEQMKTAEDRVGNLTKLEELLVPALNQMTIRAQMEDEQRELAAVEEELAQARKDVTTLEKELDLLLAQYRVARDGELARQAEQLQKRIDLAKDLEGAIAARVKDLKTTKRPDRADVDKYRALQSRLSQDQVKLEATGVRYELSATDRPRSLRLEEDGAPSRQITLAPGESVTGIAGRLTVEADGLRFSAAGKSEVSGLKQAMQETADEKAALLAQFMVETEAAFRNRAEEKQELQRELEEKTAELRSHLAGATLAGLQADLESAFEARVKNQMTSEDRERCAGQPSYPAAELRGWCDQKRGEIQQAREGIALREAKRPRDAERALHQRNLEALQRKAREAAAAFAQVDEQHREPTPLIADEIRAALKRERQEQTRLTNVLVEAERTVANLQGQLKQAQPHRALDAIQTDLEEAQEAYNREETLQQARALLKERIADKMATLAAHVPAELSKRVTEHLARLTTRAAGEVVLNSDLAVAHWSSHGSGTVWQPGQLSYGERHQAALAVKIAVARALAETAGPVFIILDDSLVTFDPQRRSAAEEFLLDLVSDEKLQVILLTCHTDWAADWHRRRPQQVTYHDLAHRVRYYEQPDVAKLQGIP